MDFKARRRHIAETDEQKCSKQCTVATTRIATVDAFTAAPASVPEKGSRKGWRKGRTSALRRRCEASCAVDFKQVEMTRHVDHIVPARLIRRLKAGNPDRWENLQCICGTCHGYELQADHKLCLRDKLGFLEILRAHHFDLARVERALAIDGL